jgi:hypothetical protein
MCDYLYLYFGQNNIMYFPMLLCMYLFKYVEQGLVHAKFREILESG